MVVRLRRELTVRVAAADVYREKQSAVADSAHAGVVYRLASAAVLFVGPVLRGSVMSKMNFSSVEERRPGPRDGETIKDAGEFENWRTWCFPLDGCCPLDPSRGWPAFNTCFQKKVARQLPETQKLSLFLSGATARRTEGKHE